jgi:hypothetical protein
VGNREEKGDNEVDGMTWGRGGVISGKINMRRK